MSKQRGRGGKKGRKAKRGFNNKRELDYKEDGQEYAQVIKLLGGNQASISCFDGVTRIGLICGRMRNRTWLKPQDIVLVSLREFENDAKKCDIIHKYFPEEAKQLKAMGELPEATLIEDRAQDENNINLEFEEDEDEEDYDQGNDDDDDLPPGSSDEEYWEAEHKKDQIKAANKNAGVQDSDEEVEEKPVDKKKPGPKDAKDAKDAKDVKQPVKPAPPAKDEKKPTKQDKKKEDLKRAKDAKNKKQGRGGGSDSEDSKDALDDI